MTDICLCYGPQIDFEIDPAAVDPAGNDWWEAAGVLVLIDAELYIRAYAASGFGLPLINIKTGSRFSEQHHGNHWTFGRWTLYVRDIDRRRAIKLYEFNPPALQNLANL